MEGDKAEHKSYRMSSRKRIKILMPLTAIQYFVTMTKFVKKTLMRFLVDTLYENYGVRSFTEVVQQVTGSHIQLSNIQIVLEVFHHAQRVISLNTINENFFLYLRVFQSVTLS